LLLEPQALLELVLLRLQCQLGARLERGWLLRGPAVRAGLLLELAQVRVLERRAMLRGQRPELEMVPVVLWWVLVLE